MTMCSGLLMALVSVHVGESAVLWILNPPLLAYAVACFLALWSCQELDFCSQKVKNVNYVVLEALQNLHLFHSTVEMMGQSLTVTVSATPARPPIGKLVLPTHLCKWSEIFFTQNVFKTASFLCAWMEKCCFNFISVVHLPLLMQLCGSNAGFYDPYLNHIWKPFHYQCLKTKSENVKDLWIFWQNCQPSRVFYQRCVHIKLFHQV